jgi:hypothetical protein
MTGYASRKEKSRNAYRILVENFWKRHYLKEFSEYLRIMIK